MLCVAALTCAGVGVLNAADTAGEAFFESKIRPLLVARCYKCHSGDKTKGKLALDTRTGWQNGGISGPAILPGNPKESLLIQVVRPTNIRGLLMPPKDQGDKLSDADVANLIQWIAMGAPDPREVAAPQKRSGMTLEEGRKHWAFQPIARPTPPVVKHRAWPRSPIDQFVLAQLETNGLPPAADSDRHPWLRRVTFDITGLPPTPEEIAAFVGDPTPQAHERVVDRLIASPAFGEKWARHWLDIVGYADEIGVANTVPAIHAWRYRDYVIRAFNTDKPFDQFIREQVAGDLLPASSIDQHRDAITATGFLLLGEIHIVEADKLQQRADVVDHQIQKIGTAFLGQTLGCVRCHDHKFDPITVGDYYGLAGIFNSSESVYVTGRGVWSSILATDLPETPAQRAERELALRTHSENVARLKQEHAQLEKELAEVNKQLAAPATKTGAAEPSAISTPPAADPKARKAELEKKLADLTNHLRHLDYIEPKSTPVYAIREAAAPADAHIHVRGNARAPGAAVPRGFIRVMDPAPWPKFSTTASGRIELANWLVRADHPLPARVTANRIWQKFFGEGLVRSLDYYGARGERPSHPELLDWLAGEFIRNGWSQKKLIRQITLSRAYQMSSTQNLAAAARDPDNRLLARMPPRRLDAEAIRDAVLAVSGDLLSGGNGPALALHFFENVGGLDPKNPNPVSYALKKFPEDQLRRRAIYLPVIRSGAQPGPAEVRNLFDFVAPTEMTSHRPSTTVATQALFLMNSEFIRTQAGKLADWALKQDAADDDVRLAKLYLRTLNRPATQTEQDSAQQFLNATAKPSASQRRDAWAAYCHALLSSNEFLFRL